MNSLLRQKIKRKVKTQIENIAPYNSFQKPIFIISPPRSGSTLLFHCLQQFEELYFLQSEADYIWWPIFPYEEMDDPADYLGKKQLSYQNIRNLRKRIYEDSVKNYLRNHHQESPRDYLFGLKSIRYLDKTIANCFHLEFLAKAFPTAQYIFLVRDPRATIASMLEGWSYAERFGKPQLTPIIQQDSTAKIEHWSYPAPPDWQTVIDQPLAQICAWSWQQHIEYPLNFFQGRSQDVKWVRYEDLLENFEGVIEDLAKYFNLKLNSRVKNYTKAPPISPTAISKPDPIKWKSNNYKQIEAIFPRIEKISQKIGYDLNP
ncbi:MAG: sulfotransferase [Spirulinaceae cyanobacterium]